MNNTRSRRAAPRRLRNFIARHSHPGHARRWGVVAISGLVWALAGANNALADELLGLGMDVGVMADDNVTRGHGSGNVLSDQIISMNFSKVLRAPVSNNARLLVHGLLGFNGHTRFAGLSNAMVGVQGEFQYRPSASFSAPTYGLSLRTSIEEYNSKLRDSYRSVAGFSVRKPITDRLQFFSALSYTWRDSKSEVFDTRETALRASADLALTRHDTLYLGVEYRVGDIVSTGRPAVPFVDLATAIVLDDVFTDTTRYAYKMDGNTGLLSLGYHRAFSERHALDLSWRMANATPSSVAGASYAATQINYTVNQFALAYLMRF